MNRIYKTAVMKNVVWLIQDSGMSNFHLELNFSTIQKLGFHYANFGFIKDTKHMTNLENILTDPDSVFISRGGTKLLNILNNVPPLSELNPHLSTEQLSFENKYIESLKNSIFYNEKYFDQAYYSTLDLPNKQQTFPIPIKSLSIYNPFFFNITNRIE